MLLFNCKIDHNGLFLCVIFYDLRVRFLLLSTFCSLIQEILDEGDTDSEGEEGGSDDDDDEDDDEKAEEAGEEGLCIKQKLMF